MTKITKEQVSHTGLWTSIIALLPIVQFLVLEPAAALEVKVQAHQVAMESYQQSAINIQVDLLEMRIDNANERIRDLKIKERSRRLTDEELLRLEQYKDKAEKLERKLDRLMT